MPPDSFDVSRSRLPHVLVESADFHHEAKRALRFQAGSGQSVEHSVLSMVEKLHSTLTGNASKAAHHKTMKVLEDVVEPFFETLQSHAIASTLLSPDNGYGTSKVFGTKNQHPELEKSAARWHYEE